MFVGADEAAVAGKVFIGKIFHVYAMAKKKNEGFQSSAGLVRYFDTDDDKSPKISPYYIIGFAIVLSIAVLVANSVWPM